VQIQALRSCSCFTTQTTNCRKWQSCYWHRI